MENKEPEYLTWLSKTSERPSQKALCSRHKQNTNSDGSEGSSVLLRGRDSWIRSGIKLKKKKKKVWDALDKHGDGRGDSPGITSQMGTSRVCSKLAKLHSSFPSNTPSQSPIGLSWESWRHENLVKLSFTPHHCATSATLPWSFLMFGEVKCLVAQAKKKLLKKLSQILCPMIIQTVYLIFTQPKKRHHPVQILPSWKLLVVQRFLSKMSIYNEFDASATSKSREGEAGRRVRQSSGLSSARCWPLAMLLGHTALSLYLTPRVTALPLCGRLWVGCRCGCC